ncbi:MAG: CAP domain-containing protein [Flavobacteriales bacterium]|nr:CAP domain-containing protein [Flavobacteriales bacterium]
MKNIYNGLIAIVLLVTITSCSKEDLSDVEDLSYNIDLSIVSKNDVKMSRDILELVNAHRVSIGLDALVMDQQYASAYAVVHTDYMIEISKINHDNFHLRSQALKNRGASRVSENVAFGYTDAAAVVNGWLNSPSHRQNIEGDYSHSGFGVFKNEQGNYFFTQLFYLQK